MLLVAQDTSVSVTKNTQTKTPSEKQLLDAETLANAKVSEQFGNLEIDAGLSSLTPQCRSSGGMSVSSLASEAGGAVKKDPLLKLPPQAAAAKIRAKPMKEFTSAKELCAKAGLTSIFNLGASKICNNWKLETYFMSL